MQVEILRNCKVSGEHAEAGETISVGAVDGEILIAAGCARHVVEEEPDDTPGDDSD